MELLEKLGINWGLLIAQVVNFAIVAGVLTYLVYKPVLNLIDQRSERIRKAMEDAKKIEDQKKEMDAFRVEQMKKIDAEVGAFFERSKKEAEEMRQQILGTAQEEANRILQKGEQQLKEERARVLGEVQGNVAAIIVRMTEKILEREWSPADQKKRIADLTQELSTAFR
ncbi:MAG: F0F1 ATP synthase subunit B [Candidatus Peribacteraceae bacterium]|jgi:F-type H+-transporting ATPase subunit b